MDRLENGYRMATKVVIPPQAGREHNLSAPQPTVRGSLPPSSHTA